ncbi:MAG TPA: MinD/ParA family protein [Alphaproteobacteria bacterium]|nr:MinD/ParA family protein [Alphaproteobacteria bacterium]
MTAISLASVRQARAAKGRNVIAVASGKGGVGKTWFAVTLAHALARAGKHTLLFDGDLGLANVDIQLGLMPERDLSGVIAGTLTLRQAVTTLNDAGFDVIAGRSGSGSLAALPGPRLALLHDGLMMFSSDYDRVVIDLGAGVEETVRVLAGEAGTILVVTTAEPTALTDAYAFIKLAAAGKPGADIRIVVNMAASPREGERTYHTILKACENFLKIAPPLAGVVRRDRLVADSIRHQTPILSRHPNSDAANDVALIAKRLLETP